METVINELNQEWKQVQEGLREQSYLCDDGVAVLVYITQQLKKPLLVEGPAGVGKTELAKAMSRWLKAPLIRLQCYEGLDEAKALYEWNYRKQLLSIQAGFGSKEDWQTLEHDLFAETFLISRPLLQAITAPQSSVLLIDEIDKVDQEFEALLLEVLSDWQISIPELGTIKSRVVPTVVLTSNNTRELSEALKRRCFYIYLDYPLPGRELAIIRTKLPGIDGDLARQVVEYAQLLRRKDLKKAPSIAEVIDWADTLVQLNIASLEEEAIQEIIPATLPALVKYHRDLDKALAALKEMKTLSQAGE